MSESVCHESWASENIHARHRPSLEHDVQESTARSLAPLRTMTLAKVVLVVLLISSSTKTTTAAVTMTSSASNGGVCPGDTVVFTCVTDTDQLTWRNHNGDKVYKPASQINEPEDFGGIFVLKLIHARYESTATAYNVSLNDDGLNITCTGHISNIAQNNSVTNTINIASPPSAPLNLSLSSGVIISWVAPLDTPLCVHSYTVTVRNSSHVMVYNTTDNSTSMNITDLTPGGVYSVTVAGRDGAGRLGQELIKELPEAIAVTAHSILSSSVHQPSKSTSSILFTSSAVTTTGTPSSCVIPIQSSSPCECPTGQAVQSWVWIAIVVPWTILVVVIAAILVCCCMKVKVPLHKRKRQVINQEPFVSHSNRPRMKYQVPTSDPPLPTNVVGPAYDDIKNCQLVTEGKTAELAIEGRIYDEVQDYYNNGTPPFHMKTNTSYKCNTATASGNK